MTTSPRLGFTYLEEGETIPETSVNEIASYLEAAGGHFIFQGFAIDTPPASPAELDTYWTGSAPTGAWAGQASKIAIRINTGWAFVTAKEGMTAWTVGSGLNGYDGSAWVEPTVGAGSVTIALAVEEDGVEESATVNRLNFTGNVNVSVAGGEATINMPTGSSYTDAAARIATQEWAPNFTGAADLYIPAREAMTISQGNAAIGTGTLAYAKSTTAAPGTFSSTTLPVTLESGAWLKVTASAVTGFVATHLKRTA